MVDGTGPSRLERTGRWMIAAGVAVWLVYGLAWLAFGRPHAAAFLPFHLAGVLPGAVLSRWGRITARWGRRGRVR